MWIKICGNTNVEDALLAAELGADALGFVFAESARQVNASQVAEIMPRLPSSVEKIGVFSSQHAREIADVVRKTGLTGVQLHGGFNLELVRLMDAEFSGRITIIQVLHWRIDDGAAHAAEMAQQLNAIAAEPAIHRVLVDSVTTSASGGTGRSFDWIAARETLSGASGLKVIAAGGLNHENVRRALEVLEPWGVDVVSGVEASKGRKDVVKLKKFIEAARGF